MEHRYFCPAEPPEDGRRAPRRGGGLPERVSPMGAKGRPTVGGEAGAREEQAMICDATLVFQLTTARGALPVQGAGILVTDPATGRNTYLTTDPSGRSRVLCVTAPPLAWSQSP